MCGCCHSRAPSPRTQTLRYSASEAVSVSQQCSALPPSDYLNTFVFLNLPFFQPTKGVIVGAVVRLEQPVKGLTLLSGSVELAVELKEGDRMNTPLLDVT